ncbi:MAG TPA: hypothetical protein PLG59_12880, partial [bacterium]|nr:hypothetical protein [bacterium]
RLPKSAPAALPLSTTSSGPLPTDLSSPLSATLSSPFPATGAVELGPVFIGPATLPNIVPPSDEQLRDVERLRRKIAPLEIPSSTASAQSAGEMFDITPERRVIPLSPSGN